MSIFKICVKAMPPCPPLADDHALDLQDFQ